MQEATQQLTNTAKLKEVRRDIARVRTLIHQKADRHERMSRSSAGREAAPPAPPQDASSRR